MSLPKLPSVVMFQRQYYLVPFVTMLLLSGCVQQPVKPETASQTHVGKKAACACNEGDTLPPLQIPDVERYTLQLQPTKPGELPKGPDYQLLRPAEWAALEGLDKDNLVAAWGAWLQSCSVLKRQEPWRAACTAAEMLGSPDNEAVRGYFYQYFQPYQLTTAEGGESGLITGYYEPLMRGSRSRTERYRYPLYTRPDDLVTVELGGLYADLAGRRLRGKINGNKLTPYYSRGEIEIMQSPLAGKEMLWVDDIVDLFFLQIQGSGMIKLENGEQIHVGYADQNGHPYQSIGKVLIERGELTADKASMQGIKDWGRRNPDKLRDLLNANPSYVFFRELPEGLTGPLGALGVPLAAERCLAVDPRYVPLGAPVFLSTTQPGSRKPLQQLMLAQDTGGAIKGAIRADFFWGAGFEAGRKAGSMKQQGRMWVLLPKELQVSAKSQ